MQIYISSSQADLPVATQLADLLARHLSAASVGDVTIYTPRDNSAQAGIAEQQMAGSGFVVLLLSPAALSDPGVARDLDQVRRLRAADAVKFFVTVVLQPLPPAPAFDDALAGLRSVDAVSSPLDEAAAQLAYYATWRPRQTGGRVAFAPPPEPPARRGAPPAPPAEAEESAPQEPDSWYIEEERGPGEPAGAPPLPPTIGGVPPAPPGAPGAPPAPPYAPPPPDVGAPPAPGYAGAPPAPWDAPDQAPSAPPVPVTPSTAAASTLQFSAYHPNTLPVETWHTLLVYTYLGEALAQIQADAATFTELGSAPTVARGQSAREVAKGVELTVEPHMEGVTFSPERDSFVWRGNWHRSLLRFSGAAELAGREQRGWIDIYAAPMVPVARIDLTFPFHDVRARAEQLAAQPPRGMIVSSNLYDAVFISYSHRDGEAFRQACDEYRRFGVTIYTDQLLEAGAQYERELSQMIEAANVFHLLWSQSSAGSPECRKEWLAALQREPSERFIKPWFWKQPLSPVPGEFAEHRISFKYEPLRRSLWRPETWF
jgi:hypothetical protein